MCADMCVCGTVWQGQPHTAATRRGRWLGRSGGGPNTRERSQRLYTNAREREQVKFHQ